MSKRDSNLNQLVMATRRAERAERVEALREGRKLRATRFTDRRKEASRKACRGKVAV